MIALTGWAAAAQQSAPRFADHPERKISNVRVKQPLIPKSWDEDSRLRFQDSVPRDARSNFAGRYYLAVWGCGSACVVGAIVEAATGKVIDIPFTVSGWREVHDDFQGIDFRKDSRLIVFSGARNEKDGDMGRHFYVLKNGNLRWLASIGNDGNFLNAPR